MLKVDNIRRIIYAVLIMILLVLLWRGYILFVYTDCVIHNEDEANRAMVYWTAVLSLGTFSLAIAAVLQDKIKRWLSKAKLEFIVKVDSADCQKVLVRAKVKRSRTLGFAKYEEYIQNVDLDAYYIRLEIFNSGVVSAENVEVFVTSLLKFNEEKKDWEIVEKFSQQNLIWNTFGEGLVTKYTWDYISPKTFQYINLGVIFDPNFVGRLDNETLEGEPNGTVYFSLQLFMKSYNQEHLLKEGTYLLRLMIASSNTKIKERDYVLIFNGKWTGDRKEMLAKNIQVVDFVNYHKPR